MSLLSVFPSLAAARPWSYALAGRREAARLGSASARERAGAAYALSRWGESHRAVQALLARFGQEVDPTVKRAVLFALARRGDPAAVPSLIETLRAEDEDEVRRAAANALAAIASPDAVEALVRGLGSDETANFARAGLLRIGASTQPYLLRALHRHFAEVKIIRLLGDLRDRKAVSALLPWTADKRANVRAEAVRSLGLIGDRRASHAIVTRLGDRSRAVVSEAANALALVADPKDRETILRTWTSAVGAERRGLLTALLRVDPRTAISLMGKALRSGNEQARAAAIEVATHSKDRAIVPILVELMKQNRGGSAVLEALANVEAGEGLDPLLDAVEGRSKNLGFCSDPKAFSEGKRGTIKDGEERKRSFCSSPEQQTELPAFVVRAVAWGTRKWGSVAPRGLLEKAWRFLARITPPRSKVGSNNLRKHVEGLLWRAVARDPAPGHLLRGYLSSQDCVIRAEAALGLELLGQRKGEDSPLVAALAREGDPEAFRRLASAAVALNVRVPLRISVRAMEFASIAPEAMMLAAAVGKSAEAMERDSLRESLRRALEDSHDRTRSGAAFAIAWMEDREAWRALAHSAEDPVPEVRLAATHALMALSVREAAPSLRARLRIESDAWVREALKDAIEGLEKGEASEPFIVGSEVLSGRFVSPGAQIETREAQARALLVDIVLRDGRWWRLRPLPNGDFFVADLAPGTGRVRARLAGESTLQVSKAAANCVDPPPGTR